MVRRREGTRAGHENAEGMASFGVRVESTVGRVNGSTVLQLRLTALRSSDALDEVSKLLSAIKGGGDAFAF